MKSDSVTTDVLQYSLTSTAWAGEVVLEYNAASLLVRLDAKNAAFTTEQHTYFLRALPRELAELQEFVSKTKTLTLTQVEQTVTFEQFWNKYDLKAVSSKKKTAAKWNKLSKTEQIKAYNYIKRYEASIPTGVAKKYAETYLNAELWNN